MKLRAYQQRGLERLLALGGDALLADEPGLGKTAMALCYCRALAAASVLVVCPASLRLNWRKEMAMWWGAEPLLGADVLSYEGLVKAVRAGLPPYAVAIFDEAHYLKNPAAARTKAALSVRAGRRLFLTGTPIVNRPMDLWPILRAMGCKMSRTAYGKRYCAGALKPVGFTRGRPSKWAWDFSGASHLEELAAGLSRRWMLRRLKAEVLSELPAKTRSVIELPADGAGDPPRLLALGARLVQSWDAYGERASGAAVGLMPKEIAELTAWRLETGRRKLPQVIAYLRDVLLEEEEKIVVFAWHREIIDALAAAFAAVGVAKLYGGMTDAAKDAALRAFQEGPARLFVGQIATAGTGLTLTAAATVLFAEIDWVPGNMTQAEDRCHRIGQDSPVRVIILAQSASVDLLIASALVAKAETINRAVRPSDGPTPALAAEVEGKEA
jgi:SWI/SNF-related matrix-associated actin-dependent regulator 1 of chromatin subfamily A